MGRVKRPLLWPLVPVYAVVTGARRWLAGWGLVRRRWLAGPVISVGSCSAGGAGKTPVVLLLTELLKRRGYGVTILTRGYGRTSKTVERVHSHGSVMEYGDEPVMMAQRTAARVYVGANRYEAGLLAEQESKTIPKETSRPVDGAVGVHVLDDGFQHWGLGRDLDVVLLTEEDLEDTLLPAGNLRESLGALKDADVIVLREEELEATERYVARLRSGMRAPVVWVIRRHITLRAEGEGAKRPLAFCGIARPEGFVAMLREHGVEVAGTIFFPDHHPYQGEDVERLIRAAKELGADGFVTTQKDVVKLVSMLATMQEAVGQVMVAQLDLELVDEKVGMDALITRVRAIDRRRRKKVWR